MEGTFFPVFFLLVGPAHPGGVFYLSFGPFPAHGGDGRPARSSYRKAGAGLFSAFFAGGLHK